ncbi:MAG TPA: phage protein Gp27 family protein [Stellaceae bacterium]|nr:phage protein Gp27 family protein [Stellaceae bacterium]
MTAALDKIGEKLVAVRQISDAFVARLGSSPEDDQGRLLIEVMQSVIFDLLRSADSDGVTLDPHGVMLVSRAIKDLVSADKIRRETAAKLEKIAKTPGIDAATLRRVREEVYGLDPQAAAPSPASLRSAPSPAKRERGGEAE